LITGAEVATVAKAGSSVAQGIKATLAQPESRWPNAHEALMELYIIVDDWCTSAEESNEAAHVALSAGLGPATPPASFLGRGQMPGPSQMAGGGPLSNVFPGYIERTTQDAEALLNPPVPWLSRWRRSRSRSAARRTLRSMLRIYCPDLLDAFEEAVANRAECVVEHRRGFAATLADPQTSLEVLRTMVVRMDRTLNDLRAVRDDLRELLRGQYPMRPTTDR
jgi:hypothetical protein